QLHRLRLWPPARLTQSNLSADFDLESLRIEYPFADIAAEDIAEIKRHPELFAGYFPPQSRAGSGAQLAQVEMFFHHAIALAPITIAAVASFAEDRLLPAFYALLSDGGGVARADLDWESGNLSGNWSAIEPLLYRWIPHYLALDPCQERI